MKLERFKRQYIFCPKEEKHEVFNSWQSLVSDEYVLYAEKSLNILQKKVSSSCEVFLIGYWINPKIPEQSNTDILDKLCESDLSVNSIVNEIYGLSGRFVLIVKQADNILIFNDACSYRPVQYTYKKEKLIFSSSIKVLAQCCKLTLKEDELKRFKSSDYFMHTPTFMYPSNYSFFQNVSQLVPNHYYNFKKRTQIRFYPNEKITLLDNDKDISECIKSISKLLKDGIKAVGLRNKLSLSITSGNDSRLLLSLVKEQAKDIFFWVCYRSKKDSDYYLPKKMLEKFNLKLNPIKLKKTNKEYKNFYKNNTAFFHPIWIDFNFSYLGKIPNNLVEIRGVAAEIARNYYYPSSGVHPDNITMEFIKESTNQSYVSLDFLYNSLKEWLVKTQSITKKYNYKLLDFLFWEHRQGMWQAQSQIESDHIFEVFVPYNNREILDLMLSLPNELRDKIDPIFYQEIIKLNGPELLDFPINPKSKHTFFELKLMYYKKALIFKLKKILLSLKK